MTELLKWSSAHESESDLTPYPETQYPVIYFEDEAVFSGNAMALRDFGNALRNFSDFWQVTGQRTYPYKGNHLVS